MGADGDTENRVIEAFSDLGISVFNGMVTSVGASIPLFLCQLQFFRKFGIFICFCQFCLYESYSSAENQNQKGKVYSLKGKGNKAICDITVGLCFIVKMHVLCQCLCN